MDEPGLHAQVTRAADDAFGWLRDAAWPTWLAHGVDWGRGAFHEQLDLRDLACRAGYRRLRVAARQVYVFSLAHQAGLARAGEAVELGIAFLRRRARQPEGSYARRFDLQGEVIDPSRDLYDHAFVLLALASAARVLPAAPLREEALALLRFLDGAMRHPQGGYVESLPPALPRRQNPHMHLLEAFLAAAESFGDEVFAQRAGEMVALLHDRMFDRASFTLPEYFAEDWTPQRPEGAHLVEPGHHAEWVWLLDWHARLAAARALPARPHGAAAAGLLAFMDRHGTNPALGTLRDEVWSDGRVKAAGSRLWPQTERLKAEVLRADATQAGIAKAYTALDLYVAPAQRGLWRERLREDGSAPEEPAPASSLYHLTCAIVTARRALHGQPPGAASPG